MLMLLIEHFTAALTCFSSKLLIFLFVILPIFLLSKVKGSREIVRREEFVQSLNYFILLR